MIFKIAAVLIILFLIYLLFFKKSREIQVNQNRKVKQKEEDIMYECPTCKTFVSKDEAILSSGKYYCSKECLR
ncbi:MAG: PP0621 family protein [Candidatus Marinarcus sp.]|uniref:PP0621 family protein n=1 Tax=Candidatus Marinarcus sp. TaxID=3100987 RepID=UPI003AFF7529